MKLRTRNLTYALLLAAALALIVVGRMALTYRPWLDWLLAVFGPTKDFIGGAFAGITQPYFAPPFFTAAAGCALLAWLLPRLSESLAPLPVIAARPLRGPNRIVVAILLVIAAVLGGTSAVLLHTASTSNAVIAWLVAVAICAIAAAFVDWRRGTSVGNPLPQRVDLIIVVCLFLGELLLLGHDLDQWHWVGTPDEANFFPFAKDLARGTSSAFILSEAGMYNVHPVLSSYYQALFMRLFGIDVFGWKLSSAFALAAALPFVYVFCRELWSRRVGVWAAVLFGATPLAVGFAHFGYNNEQVYLFIPTSLATLMWAMRRRSALGYYIAGAIGGFAAFTFFPARIALLLLLVLAWAVRETPWRERRAEWAMLFLATALAALPCWVHPVDTFGRMFGQTNFAPAPTSAPATSVPATSVPEAAVKIEVDVLGQAARLARHWTLSMLFPIWFPNPSHFQTNAVIDPLQGMLAVTGLFFAWRSFRLGAGYRFLAIAYPFSALTVGAISQHDCPPLTRLFFLCPFISMLAATSLDRIAAALGPPLTRPRFAAGFASAAVVVSSLWGLGLLRYNVYVRGHGYGEGTTSEIVRMMRALPEPWRIVYVQKVPTYMASVDAVIDAYGFRDRFTYLRDSPEVFGHTPKAAVPPFLLVDDLEGDNRTRFETAMSEKFPGRPWLNTAPGERWNLHVLIVGRDADTWEPPRVPYRSDFGRMVLGFLDW